MKIMPIYEQGDLYRGLEAVPQERQALVNEAIRREAPEILSFLPGTDTTRVTFRNIEVCSYILHYNFKQLLRLPSLGLVDQKAKYSSIYDPIDSLIQFTKNTGVKMLDYQVVAEIMLLYGLTAKDMRTMSTWCCNFRHSETFEEPDYGKLTSIYTKKQLAKLLKEHIDPDAAKLLPPRILKGMEYPSYADFLHVFQSLGYDPYEALFRFVQKEPNKVPKLGISGLKEDAFILDYLDGAPSKPATAPKTKPDPKPVPEPKPEPVPRPEPMPEPIQAAEPVPAPQVVADAEPTPVLTPKLTVEEDPELSALPMQQSKDEEMAFRFAEVINEAVQPMNGRTKVVLGTNILNLRRSVADGNTAGFDALFLSSGCSHLDVFNYAARVSVAYGVPMYELFYHIIPPGKYSARQSYTVTEYTLEDISEVVNVDQGRVGKGFPVTDENLFTLLAPKPARYLSEFGYRHEQPVRSPKEQPIAEVKPEPPIKPAPEVKLEPKIEPPKATAKAQDKLEINDKERIKMNIKLRLRVCTPCDADSWENDNPDRSVPGFHWDNASPELSEKAQDWLAAQLSSGQVNLDKVKAELSKLVELPYKAQVQASGDGCRMTLELF